MLSVSFTLALVAAMLFGVVLPGHHNEVDKFNGQTREPIPAGKPDLVSEFLPFKAERTSFPKMWTECIRCAASEPFVGAA